MLLCQIYFFCFAFLIGKNHYLGLGLFKGLQMATEDLKCDFKVFCNSILKYIKILHVKDFWNYFWYSVSLLKISKIVSWLKCIFLILQANQYLKTYNNIISMFCQKLYKYLKKKCIGWKENLNRFLRPYCNYFGPGLSTCLTISP